MQQQERFFHLSLAVMWWRPMLAKQERLPAQVALSSPPLAATMRRLALTASLHAAACA
jgi:hypothetical protein